jgi:beta-galactosidase beta subunit
MNGAHETIRNNRPGSFIKVFIHECYCKLCEVTQIKSVKKLKFKIPAFILVK